MVLYKNIFIIRPLYIASVRSISLVESSPPDSAPQSCSHASIPLILSECKLTLLALMLPKLNIYKSFPLNTLLNIY
jgi:hypothetical protein